MNTVLRMRIEPDTDGTAELFAEVNAGRFSGAGSAWFGLAEISSFAQSLVAKFPLPSNTCLILQGGYWSDTNRCELKQTLLRLSVYPIGSVGAIGCRVELARPMQNDDRPESRTAVEVELVTDFEPLAEFSKQLDSLAKGDAGEAILRANG